MSLPICCRGQDVIGQDVFGDVLGIVGDLNVVFSTVLLIFIYRPIYAGVGLKPDCSFHFEIDLVQAAQR